ncbi:MAG: hypothetical protein WAW06_03090 [bacterium]
MLNLVELIAGLALIYFGLDRFAREGEARWYLFGLVAIGGLVLTVHGVLLYVVPDFFTPSL